MSKHAFSLGSHVKQLSASGGMVTFSEQYISVFLSPSSPGLPGRTHNVAPSLVNQRKITQ